MSINHKSILKKVVKKTVRSFNSLLNLPNILCQELRIRCIDIVSIDELEQQQKTRKLKIFEDISFENTEAKNFSLSEVSKHLNADSHSLDTAFSAILNNAVYFSHRLNFLLTEDCKVISDHHSLGLKRSFRRFIREISLLKLFAAKRENISGYSCVTRNLRNNNYYHCLIDNIPRIYHLTQKEYQYIDEIKVLISGQMNGVEKTFLEKLLPSNVKIKFLQSDRLYRLEKCIYLNPLTKWSSGYLPEDYIKYFTERVCPSRERRKVNRIFISRSKAKKRHIRNEDELMKQLKEYGFKRYCLEDLSPEEQMELFYDAEYVVGMHGAGLSNLLFSSEAKVIEIFPGDNMTLHYYYLCKSLNHEYRYILNDSATHFNQKEIEIDIFAVMDILDSLQKESEENQSVELVSA